MLKAAGVDELMTAIRTVHSGDVYIHSPMATKLVGDYVNRLRGGQGDDLYEKLSVRERQVLPMLAEGRTVQEIGDVLHVSPYTIQTYRKRIMQKLGIHRSNELLMYALRRGWSTWSRSLGSHCCVRSTGIVDPIITRRVSSSGTRSLPSCVNEYI